MDKLLLKNAKLIDDKGIHNSDLLIEGEKIAAVEERGYFSQLENENKIKAIDLEGKYIFPGVIDAHTHYALHSRGTLSADDFYKGSISAAAGGVTTIIDYIDFPQDADFKRAFKERCREAEDSIIDYSFHQVIEDFDSHISKKLEDLKELALASIKIFTTYKKEGYIFDKNLYAELFARLKELKLLPTVHAEDDALIEDLEAAYKKRDLTEPAVHAAVRPSLAERLAVLELGEAALKADIPIYIVHLSSAAGNKAVKELRNKGTDIFTETAPHYLMLDNALLKGENPQLYFMTPPLRSSYDNQKLWEAVSSNEIQIFATDHCAFTKEQKFQSESAFDILPGIPGTETLLPLIYSYGVARNYISLEKMVEMLSVNPAKIFGLYPQKGSLELGSDADLTVFDPELQKKLTAENLHSAAAYSPYKNFEVKGYPIITIRRGKIIFKDELKAEKGSGNFVKAHSSSLFKE
ncbi:MAG: amidohydrolase [Halanaerobium sp. MSAO_Bac5]|nr:MAG: amidohydrolase [Halanaerobium sp. MSAO_Bac5]